MLTRLLHALHGPPGGRPAGVAAGVAGGATTRHAAVTFAPPTAGPGDGRAPRDPILPHPSAMIDAWRRDVAGSAITLRDRYLEAGRRPARGTAAHAERLLVRLTVDPEMIVRQPPAAARDALAAAGDPDCDLPRIVAVVERDPALARGLMRHASSAAFAAAARPASIDEAVRRLGATGVQVAVLAGMAEALLARGRGPYHGGAYGAAAEAAWARMIRVGPLAGALARALVRVAGVPAHEAFLLGLLHDVGALVLFDLVSTLEDEVGGAVALPDGLADDAFRVLHEPLGGIALLRWGVDPRAAWAVAHHHRRTPPDAPDARGELLYLAARLDAARQRGGDVAAEPPIERWFGEGRLTLPLARVAAAVARLPDGRPD